jgi:hypothetical protein
MFSKKDIADSKSEFHTDVSGVNQESGNAKDGE